MPVMNYYAYRQDMQLLHIGYNTVNIQRRYRITCNDDGKDQGKDSGLKCENSTNDSM